MFVELADMVQSAGKLSLTIFPGANGTLKVCVAPTAEKNKELALATPLILTATPQDLDEGFAGAIATYKASRTSLEAQVQATTTVLKEAEKTQSNKAVKALDKAAKSSANPATPGASGSDASDEDDENEDDSATGAETPASASSESVPTSPAPQASGTDLLSLI